MQNSEADVETVLVGCLAGVATGERAVNLPEGPGLEDEVTSSCIDLSQGQTINFKEFVALASLSPLGSFFFLFSFLVMPLSWTSLQQIWDVSEGETAGQ